MFNAMNALILCDAHEIGPEFGKASPLALFFLLVIFAALILILVSMSKHLKKMQKYFAKTQPTVPQTSDEKNGGLELDEKNIAEPRVDPVRGDIAPPALETE